MYYEYKKLRGRIIEKYGTQNAFAEEIGISKNALSQKMTGKIGISQSDIIKWSDLLGIKKTEYADYFFS